MYSLSLSSCEYHTVTSTTVPYCRQLRVPRVLMHQNLFVSLLLNSGAVLAFLKGIMLRQDHQGHIQAVSAPLRYTSESHRYGTSLVSSLRYISEFNATVHL